MGVFGGTGLERVKSSSWGGCAGQGSHARRGRAPLAPQTRVPTPSTTNQPGPRAQSLNDAIQMSDLVQLALQYTPDNQPLVLVSLVHIQGSTYRKPGARMLVTPERTYGLMSGGCLEQEIARKCLPILEGKQSTLRLDIDTRQYLGCDGRLGLWCERVEPELLSQARIVADERRVRHCNTYPDSNDQGTSISQEPDPQAFNETLHPPRRILVFGSAPDSRPLLELARALEWQAEQIVMASDPNASPQLGATVLAQAGQVRKLKIDATTACVVMNHHFGRDLELLHALWTAPTPFLGLLGSRRRRDQLLEQLALQDELDLEARQLFAPVGIDLGAEGPHQIALEICAQIQKIMAVGQNPQKGD